MLRFACCAIEAKANTAVVMFEAVAVEVLCWSSAAIFHMLTAMGFYSRLCLLLPSLLSSPQVPVGWVKSRQKLHSKLT